MVAGGFAVTLCYHSPQPPFPQGGGGGNHGPPPPIPQGGGGLVGSHCATFLTEHDHWGGVGGAKEAWNIYMVPCSVLLPPPPRWYGSPRPPPNPRPRAPGSWHLRSHPHPDPLNSHPGTPTPRTSQPATNPKPTLNTP